MDILFSIGSGLGLRIICINLPEPTSRFAPAFIGLWEGALSHLMISLNPEQGQPSTDHFLAYGLRLVFDFILAQSPARPIAVALWTGVALLLFQAADHQSRSQETVRRKRSRRQRAPSLPSLPSHVRVYHPPESQLGPKAQPVTPNHSPPAEIPFHEQPSTPPSFFLHGEDSESSNLSPAPDQAPPLTTGPPRPPSALASQLEADEDTPQEKPVLLPTPPATFVSAEVDKDSDDSGQRLSTIIEASSGDEVSFPTIVNAAAVDKDQLHSANAKSALTQSSIRATTKTDTAPLPVPDPYMRQSRPKVVTPTQPFVAADPPPPTVISVNPASATKFERREQEQSSIRATTKTDTVPLPIPDPYMRQSRQKVVTPTQPFVAADPPPPTVISVNPASATKFLLRRYAGEGDEFQTPLNPVARALLDEEVDHVFTDNESDELQTPLTLARRVVDGPLSPLSPLLSVRLNLNDALAGSSGAHLGYVGAGAKFNAPSNMTDAPVAGTSDATLARDSLLMSSEHEPESAESEGDSSLLSTVVPNELYARGGDWRQQAREEEKRRASLKQEYDQAVKERRARDALMLKGQLSESENKVKKLHGKAAKRYYKARNPPGQLHLLDVHGLRPQEAIEETERALRSALSSGYGTLKVITGKGLHSKKKLPVLRNAVIRAMQDQKIPCEPDPNNAGVLILSLPP